MTISAIGGVNPVHSRIPAAATGKPESKEAPGVRDHDGDPEDLGTKAPSAAAPSVAFAGRVNVKA